MTSPITMSNKDIILGIAMGTKKGSCVGAMKRLQRGNEEIAVTTMKILK
jgi:hypothetical protein